MPLVARCPRASTASWASRKRRTARICSTVNMPERQAVVDVVVVVGDLVDEVDELRLEGGRLARARTPRAPSASLSGWCLIIPSRTSQVRFRPGKSGIALLQHLQDAQRLPVVLEAAVVAHQLVHDALARVAEGRVAEVVAEHQALGQLLVQAQGARHRAPDLRPLQAVREARAVVVALVVDEDLGLVLEAPEGRAVDHAVAVALVARAQRVLGLRDSGGPRLRALRIP